MKKKFMWSLLALLFSAHVWAVDGVSIELGKGDQADTARIGAIWNWDKKWFIQGDWHVSGFWEGAVGTWHGRSAVGKNQNVVDLGFTPVFRLEQTHPSNFAPYLEGAVGFHLISPAFIYANRRFGSAFQFGDHVGFGLRFGGHQQYDLGYRYQHLSNGGIKKPNQGINLNQIHFIYHY
ncbi:MAG: acyloxyacyl hydrolase [Gallionella sp.]